MKEIKPIIEKKERGKDVIIRDIYSRHGDKTPEGELAPKGFEQAKEAGGKLEKAKPYFGEAQRAEDFARTAEESTEKSGGYKGRMRVELGGLIHLSGKWKAGWKEKGAGTEAVQWYLDEYKDKERKPDDPGTMSPYEMACRIAKSVSEHSRMAERLYKGSRENLFNGSHSPIVEVFLATALKEDIEKDPVNPEGKTLMEKMGGQFKTAEQFEVDTVIDDKGEKTLKVKFRDKEYDLSEEKLEKMVSYLDKEELRKEKKEREKSESVVTAYIIRHGDTTKDKFDPNRGLTEKGKEETEEAAERIAQEIVEETGKDTEIELRGYDSGQIRANQTLIEVAKKLTDKGYKIYLPFSSQELAKDEVAFKEMKKAGLIHGEGPGIKSRIRNITLPDEAKKELKEEAKQKGEKAVITVLTTPPEKLKEMGVETPEEIFKRVESAVESTDRISQRLRKNEYPRKIIAIAATHGAIPEAYLSQKLKVNPKDIGEVPNCEGFRIDFTGKPDKKPRIQFWGKEIEKRMRKE